MCVKPSWGDTGDVCPDSWGPWLLSRAIWPHSDGHKHPLSGSVQESCALSAGSALQHLPASLFTCILTSAKMAAE